MDVLGHMRRLFVSSPSHDLEASQVFRRNLSGSPSLHLMMRQLFGVLLGLLLLPPSVHVFLLLVALQLQPQRCLLLLCRSPIGPQGPGGWPCLCSPCLLSKWLHRQHLVFPGDLAQDSTAPRTLLSRAGVPAAQLLSLTGNGCKPARPASSQRPKPLQLLAVHCSASSSFHPGPGKSSWELDIILDIWKRSTVGHTHGAQRY